MSPTGKHTTSDPGFNEKWARFARSFPVSDKLHHCSGNYKSKSKAQTVLFKS